MRKNGQMSFTDAKLTLKKKQTRRERFLAQLDELIPWADLPKAVSQELAKNLSRSTLLDGMAHLFRARSYEHSHGVIVSRIWANRLKWRRKCP